MTDLSPCPFCGAGETSIVENGRFWTGMRESDPVSVSVRHWCEKVEGQPRGMLEVKGKTEADAVSIWNTRTALSGGWVRCSERLPEDGIECELTLELEFGRAYISSYIFEGGRWVPADGIGPPMRSEVVAYRPVDYDREPYRGPA